MTWLDSTLDELAQHPVCDYQRHGPGAAEPTALAALLLAASDRPAPAREAARWLTKLQAANGAVGVRENTPTPCWTTGLAVLVWLRCGDEFRPAVDRGLNWILSMKGKTQTEAHYVGHDTTLTGWPWAEGTHSWIEPTAVQLLALRATGYGQHARSREAVRLLLDRQLPRGGCNYGNTAVMGMELRPHVQPTGLAMLALAGERDVGGRIQRSLTYLMKNVSERTTPASLGWALAGLAAHGRRPAQAGDWLATAYERVVRGGGSPYKLALLGLADLWGSCSATPRRVAEQLGHKESRHDEDN